MFNLSKPASKLWLISEVKEKDLICIGIKNKKKGKVIHTLQENKYL